MACWSSGHSIHVHISAIYLGDISRQCLHGVLVIGAQYPRPLRRDHLHTQAGRFYIIRANVRLGTSRYQYIQISSEDIYEGIYLKGVLVVVVGVRNALACGRLLKVDHALALWRTVRPAKLGR